MYETEKEERDACLKFNQVYFFISHSREQLGKGGGGYTTTRSLRSKAVRGMSLTQVDLQCSYSFILMMAHFV